MHRALRKLRHVALRFSAGWLVMISLMNLGWAAASLEPGPATDRWTNSLGLVFKPVPKLEVWFCIWETRGQDFAAFVKATGFELDTAISSMASSAAEATAWNHPGFKQDPNHPVVFVSWEDAGEFCVWLTRTEQAAGTITKNARYRLPTDAEWSQAAGTGLFPWSKVLTTMQPTNRTVHGQAVNLKDERFWLPPPAGAGNYAGEEGQNTEPPLRSTLRNYRDDYLHTAPVGCFVPNPNGLYDLGGNVWEWCEDWYRREMLPRELEAKVPFVNGDGGGKTFKVLRGASWLDSHPAILRTDVRFFEFPDHRTDAIGFRLVIVGLKP